MRLTQDRSEERPALYPPGQRPLPGRDLGRAPPADMAAPSSIPLRVTSSFPEPMVGVRGVVKVVNSVVLTEV